MQVLITNAHPRLRFSVKESERIIRTVLRVEAVRVSFLSVVFVNHRRTIILNTKYLRHHRTTDVIAFEYESEPAINGEIFINLDQAKTQSVFYGATFHEEVQRLLIHGLLHLIGYDDVSIKQRNSMRRREELFLRAFSLRRRKRAT